jgi:hypothetical protein
MYEELYERHPDAKFILTTRPIEGWLKSMEWLLREGPNIWPWRDAYDDFNREFFGSARFDSERYTEAYHRHHDAVRAWVKAHGVNLLILDLEQGYGYEELCAFLGLVVPETSYPRGNSTRSPNWKNKVLTCNYSGSIALRSIYHRAWQNMGLLWSA